MGEESMTQSEANNEICAVRLIEIKFIINYNVEIVTVLENLISEIFLNRKMEERWLTTIKRNEENCLTAITAVLSFEILK